MIFHAGLLGILVGTWSDPMERFLLWSFAWIGVVIIGTGVARYVSLMILFRQRVERARQEYENKQKENDNGKAT